MSTRLAEPPATAPDDLPPARRLAPLLAGGIAVLLGVVLAALLLRHHIPWVSRRDSAIERSAHHVALTSPATLTFARVVTTFGATWFRAVWFVAVAGYLLWRRARRLAGFFIVAVVGGLGVVNLLKLVVDRARPHLAHPVAHATGTSFPSGHAMGSTVLYGALVVLAVPLLHRWARVLVGMLAGLLVAAVCASRVLLGVHYTTDVLAGVVCGLAWLAVSASAFGIRGHGLAGWGRGSAG